MSRATTPNWRKTNTLKNKVAKPASLAGGTGSPPPPAPAKAVATMAAAVTPRITHRPRPPTAQPSSQPTTASPATAATTQRDSPSSRFW